MGARMRLFVLTFTAAASCGRDRGPPDARPAPAPEPVARADAAPPPQRPQPAEAEGPLGMPVAVVVGGTNDGARDNATALRVHRRQGWAESERGFAAAVAAAPEIPVYRFNHGCALMRLGRATEAIEEIAGAARRDPPGIFPRIEADADLASLRDDPVLGPALRRRLDAIAAAWRRLATRAEAPPIGVMVAQTRTVGDCQGDPEECGSFGVTTMADAWPGLWVEESGRFVPLVPRTGRLYDFVVDAANGRVLARSVAGHSDAAFENAPQSSLTIFSLQEPGRELASVTDFEALCVVGAAIRYSTVDHEQERGPAWHELDPSGRAHGVHTGCPPEGVTLGIARMQSAAGTLRGRRFALADGRSVELGPGPPASGPEAHSTHQVVATPDGHFVVIASVAVANRESGGCRVGHVVELVDVGAGTARPLSRGEAVAAVERSPAGKLLVQIDQTVREVDPAAPDVTLRTLPGGLRLASGGDALCRPSDPSFRPWH